MQLSVKGLSLALGILFALVMLVSGVVALMFPDWGVRFMELVGAVYPGVDGLSIGQILVGTVYALVDGLICGAVLAWLYNRLATPPELREA